MSNVHLSLTTSPSRIRYIPELLEHIDTSIFHRIFINLPLEFGRDKSKYVVPKKLSSMKNVTINRIPSDFGPITKILPSLDLVQNMNDVIISIDDDIRHDNHIFKHLIKECTKRDCVVTGIGKNISYWSSKKYGPMPRVFPFDFKPKGIHVDMIEGFSGVAYKKKFFPDIPLLKKLNSISKECMLSDDLTLSFYLKLFGRRIVSLNKMKLYGYRFSKTKYKLDTYHWGLKNNALHKGGGLESMQQNIDVNKIKYPKCYAALRSYYHRNRSRIHKTILRSWHYDFDKIFVINMKNRTNRKAQSLKILKMLGVPSNKIEISPATTPSDNLANKLKQLGFKGNVMQNFLGKKRYRDLQWHADRLTSSIESALYHKKILVETAVSISQLKIMKLSMDTNQTFLMLEDDFGPTSSFYNFQNHRMHRQIPWSLLYFGDCPSMRSGPSKTLFRQRDNKLIRSKAVCHHALAIRPSLGYHIFRKHSISPFNLPIDDELSFHMIKHNVPFALFDKPLMIQDVDLGSSSNIQNSNKIQWEIEQSNKFGTLNLRPL